MGRIVESRACCEHFDRASISVSDGDEIELLKERHIEAFLAFHDCADFRQNVNHRVAGEEWDKPPLSVPYKEKA